MPSTIVVAVPEGKEPSIASALLMVAAQEEEKEKELLKSSTSGKKMSASSATVNTDAAASGASSSSSTKRMLEGTDHAIANSFERLPKKIKSSHGSVPVREGGEKSKASTNICSADGCKNEQMIAGLCLVHGAKMSLIPSSGPVVGKKRSPVNEETALRHYVRREMNGSGHDSSDGAATSSSDNSYQEGDDWEEGDDWPLTKILKPGENDCLYGRGGATNHHSGNKKYRQLVNGKKEEYLGSLRTEKPKVAMSIVHAWRAMTPPGRFLEQDKKTRLWSDVGDEKAREKTSQALREKAPTPYVKKRNGKRSYGALAVSPFIVHTNKHKSR
ncbi:hypothetical protein ACHAWT_006919 [Skeletonema menzelii]